MFHYRILRLVTDFDVDVRLIDFGTILKKTSTEIFQLDEKFCNFPQQAIDMHLIGLIPAEFEDEWDSKITKILEVEVNKMQESNIKVEANIVFALKNTIAVDCVRFNKTMENACVIKLSIKRFMADKSYGVLCNSSKQRVIKMAENLGQFLLDNFPLILIFTLWNSRNSSD